VETIFVLLPLALLIAAIAVGFFIWAARTGQFDDLETPALRILFDDEEPQGTERSGIRNQESGIRNQESGVRNRESGIGNQEPGFGDRDSGTGTSKRAVTPES
jgi:cbb3-type cytochrome oxidase maturation protein